MSDGTSIEHDRTKPGGTTDSSPLDLNEDGIDDIQYAATKENITLVFDELKNVLTPEDNLFIYVTDHGSNDNTTQQEVKLRLWGYEVLWDYEFADLVNDLEVGTMQIVLTQCYSGGFIDDFYQFDHGRTIATSCDYNQIAQGDENFHGLGINLYTFYFVSAATGIVLGSYPPIDIFDLVDVNSNGELSFQEISDWASTAVQNHPHNYPDIPQYYSDPSGLGLILTIDDFNPASNCYNGVQDPGETGIDCGGICEPCGTYPVYIPSCVDHYQNGNETGIDCGGDCPPCGLNLDGQKEHFGEKPDNYDPGILINGYFGYDPLWWQTYPEPLHQPYWLSSHGYPYIIPCKPKFWNNSTMEDVLYLGENDGLFWESDGYQFKSNKRYTLSFYVQTGCSFSNEVLWFVLTNNLELGYQKPPNPVIFQDPEEFEIIGYVTRNFYLCEEGANKITIDFIPKSDIFSQLWIYTDYLGSDMETKSQKEDKMYGGYFTHFSLFENCLPLLTYNNPAIPGFSYADEWIKAWDNAIIEANNVVNFMAGQYVLLLPNFETEANSVFSTQFGCSSSADLVTSFGEPEIITFALNKPESLLNFNDQLNGFTNNEFKQNIRIYPNPSTNGIFHIDVIPKSNEFENKYLTVYNIYGNVIHQQTIDSKHLYLDLSLQPKGVFLIKIVAEDLSLINKIVVR